MQQDEKQKELEREERVITIMEALSGASKRLFLLLAVVVITALPLGSVLQLVFYGLFYSPSNYLIYQQPNPDDLQLKSAQVLQNGAGSYFAYARVANPNGDLAIRALPYEFRLKDSAGNTLATDDGTTYMLPGQDRYILIPSHQLQTQPASVDVTFGKFNWSRIGPLVDLSFSTEGVAWSEDPNHRFYVSAQLKNESAYIISETEVVVVLYDLKHNVIGINSTVLNLLQPDETRFFRLVWPNGIPTQVVSTEFKISVNQLVRNQLSTQNATLDTFDPRR